MEDNIFNIALEEQEKNQGHGSFWQSLFEKFSDMGYSYKDKEDLRDKVRKEKKKRGISDIKGKSHFDNGIKLPRIAIFDLESLPSICYTFRIRDTYLGTEQIIEDVCLCSWSAKLLNDDQQFGTVMTHDEALKRDDKRVTETMWEFLNSCDLIIGQNVVNFDQKMANTAYLKHGLLPTHKYQVIDTLSVARNSFKLMSNKLDYISKFLGYSGKLEHGNFDLWKRCCNGDEEALSLMLKYNFEDCVQTENVYYRLRPFIQGHPNLALYAETNDSICPRCMSDRLTEKGRYFTQSSGIYKSLRCDNCGGIIRSKVNEISKEKRASLLIQ